MGNNGSDKLAWYKEELLKSAFESLEINNQQ